LKPIAFMAMPTSNSDVTDIFFFDFEIEYTRNVANRPPANAKSGTSNGPARLLTSSFICIANTKTIDAPNAAPALVPINPGSTIGLRKSPCSRTPDTDKMEPVIAHSKTRGNLISINTPS
ncbi:MAG: hypothetical protein ABIP30_04555, partial [Ferruginibacter sp.]